MPNSDILQSRKIQEYPKPFNNQTPYKSIEFKKYKNLHHQQCKYSVFDTKMSKVIILGDVAVGKSCLLNRFCHQLFNSNYKATIGVDFEVEQFQILGVPFNLQIWDTAGQERFKSIAQSYYRFAQVIVLVFDISNIKSLYNCKTWLKDALNTSSKDPHIYLVGTKKDLVSSVTYDNIESLAMDVANTMNAEYWAVSSQTGENVHKLFYRIAALAFEKTHEADFFQRNIPVIDNEVISFKKNTNKQVMKNNRGKCCV